MWKNMPGRKNSAHKEGEIQSSPSVTIIGHYRFDKTKDHIYSNFCLTFEIIMLKLIKWTIKKSFLIPAETYMGI